MTGTSVSTPKVVASAAGEVVPNSAIATATASSKKLDAPIIPAGAAIYAGLSAAFKNESFAYLLSVLKKVLKRTGDSTEAGD